MIYSLGETLGIAAIGYGSYLTFVDTENSRFVRVLDTVPSLHRDQKEALASAYLLESADRGKSVRRIRALSHGLTAGLDLHQCVDLKPIRTKNRALLHRRRKRFSCAEFCARHLGRRKNRESSIETARELGTRRSGRAIGFAFLMAPVCR